MTFFVYKIVTFFNTILLASIVQQVLKSDCDSCHGINEKFSPPTPFIIFLKNYQHVSFMHRNNITQSNNTEMRTVYEGQNRCREFFPCQECEFQPLNVPFEDKTDLFPRHTIRYSPRSYPSWYPESKRNESEDTESSIHHFRRTLPMNNGFCTCPTCTHTHWCDAHYAHYGYMYRPIPPKYPGRFYNYSHRQLYISSEGERIASQQEAIADDTILDKEVEMINARESIFRKRKHLDSYHEHQVRLPCYQYPIPYHDYYYGYYYQSNPYCHPYGTDYYRMMPLKRRRTSSSDPRLGSTIYVERSISPALSDITDCDSMNDLNDTLTAKQGSIGREDTSIWKHKSGTKVLQLLIDTDVEEDCHLKAPSPIQRNANGNFFDWGHEGRFIRTVSPRST